MAGHPGHVHAGDTVTFKSELLRSFGPANTERPWTNRFEHIRPDQIRGGWIHLWTHDERVNMESINSTYEYMGRGTHHFARTFPEDELEPGEQLNHHLHIGFTDELGYAIDETGEDYESTVSRHGGAAPPADTISFQSNILPILPENCRACHGSAGGLFMDTYEDLMAGGVSGPAIIPGEAHESLLVQRIEAQMPLGGNPLPEDDIGLIEAWINPGAENN